MALLTARHASMMPAAAAAMPAAAGLTSDSGRYCLLRHITQPRPGYTSPNLWPDALIDTTLGSWKSLQCAATQACRFVAQVHGQLTIGSQKAQHSFEGWLEAVSCV
jgi:hypothetical protein